MYMSSPPSDVFILSTESISVAPDVSVVVVKGVGSLLVDDRVF